MWTWIAIGTVVAVLLIAFLSGISSALQSVNTSLGQADVAVRGAGGNVTPLPDHIAAINLGLGMIDTDLKPIPAQADQIITNLKSITGSLTSVDGSLKDTSATLGRTTGSLVSTSGSLVDTANSLGDTAKSLANTSGILGGITKSLVDTSNVLVSVKDRVVTVKGTLQEAQSSPDGLGAQSIWQKVEVANGVLQPAKDDTGNVTSGLKSVNGSLSSVCKKLGAGRGC